MRVRRTIAADAYWAILALFTLVVVLWLLVSGLAWLFPSLVLRTQVPAAMDVSVPQRAEDVLFSAVNLGFGLFIVWLVPDNRTARWLALGVIGTAAAFNLSAHHLFHELAQATGGSIGVVPAGVLHVGFHLAVAASFAYALMLFPDGELPPLGLVATSLAVVGALAATAFAFVLYERAAWFSILYFGLLVVCAGAFALGHKAVYSRDPKDRLRAKGYLEAYLLGTLVMVAFAVLNVVIHRHQLLGPMSNEATRSDLVVLSLAPELTAIPIVLFVGLLRDRLWGVDDVASKPKLYGILVAAVMTTFTGIDLAIHTVAQRVGDSLAVSLVVVLLTGFLLEGPRDRLVKACRRLVYGTANPETAMTTFSAKIAASVSVADVLPALAGAMRGAVGVCAGELNVPVDGVVRSLRWPPTGLPPYAERIELTEDGRRLGDVSVTKVTERRLSKREAGFVRDLATEAALAVRARSRVDPVTDPRNRPATARPHRLHGVPRRPEHPHDRVEDTRRDDPEG